MVLDVLFSKHHVQIVVLKVANAFGEALHTRFIFPYNPYVCKSWVDTMNRHRKQITLIYSWNTFEFSLNCLLFFPLFTDTV